MTKTTSIAAAIERSQSHNEIASVQVENWDAAIAEIEANNPSDNCDYSEENGTPTHRVYDVYGYADDAKDGDMDWR